MKHLVLVSAMIYKHRGRMILNEANMSFTLHETQ